MPSAQMQPGSKQQPEVSVSPSTPCRPSRLSAALPNPAASTSPATSPKAAADKMQAPLRPPSPPAQAAAAEPAASTKAAPSNGMAKGAAEPAANSNRQEQAWLPPAQPPQQQQQQKDAGCPASSLQRQPSFSDGASDDGSLPDTATSRPWYRSLATVAATTSVVVAIALAVTGLLMQFAVEERQALHTVRAAYPFLFFFAALPPLALILRWLCWKLYEAAEFTAIREELYFLRPLRKRLATQLVWLCLLVWFQVCFNWVWCEDSLCGGHAYQETVRVMWRLLVCITLFAAASLVKCGAARLLSYSFYRTAHFAKVREAIEKELYLIRLAQARSTLQPEAATLPSPDKGGGSPQHLMGRAGAWLADRGSTIWQRAGSMMLARQPGTVDEDGMPPAAAQPLGCGGDGGAAAAHIFAVDSSSHTEMHHAHQGGREHSFEQFLATRVPSCLPQQAQHGNKAAGSKAGSAARLKQSGRSSSRTVSGLVAGIDDMLLQPQVCLATMAAKQDSRAARQATPITEQELGVLRKQMGVQTFSTFVRYLNMTPKEEANHLRQVRRFAKGLFWNIKAADDRDCILPVDFELFFQGDLDASKEAFKYFDRNGDGSISCVELQESAAVMLKERKNIAASIKDTESVVDSLEGGIGLLVHFLWIIFYLLVWGVNIVEGFTTFSATVLALTFVFGDSLKEVFESALYLFAEHPYDVGDALWLGPAAGNGAGTTARVKKIDLMYTVMKHSSGELVYHKNSSLRGGVLVNLSRSGNKCEVLSLLVDLDTPEDVLVAVDAAVTGHIAANQHQFHQGTKPLVVWRGLEDPCKLRLGVSITYSFTGEDVRRHLAARSGVLAVMRQELQRLGVRFTLPLQHSMLDRLL